MEQRLYFTDKKGNLYNYKINSDERETDERLQGLIELTIEEYKQMQIKKLQKIK